MNEVGRMVGRLVGRSVGWLVVWSVGLLDMTTWACTFFKIDEASSRGACRVHSNHSALHFDIGIDTYPVTASIFAFFFVLNELNFDLKIIW